MTKINLFAIFFLSLTFNTWSQKVDEKHENHYQAITPIETNDFKIEFANSHSQKAFTLIKMIITNKTNDYLEFDPSKMEFIYDSTQFSPTSSSFIIKPYKKKTKVIKMMIAGFNHHVDNYSINITGLIRIPTKGKTIDLPKFDLPASQNIVTKNGLTCTLKKLTKETKETNAKFLCENSTGKIVLVNTAKTVITTKTTSPYANDKKKKEELLENGKTVKFDVEFHIPGKTLDMQFANMKISWEDTFLVTDREPINFSQQIDLILDPGLTDGKN